MDTRLRGVSITLPLPLSSFCVGFEHVPRKTSPAFEYETGNNKSEKSSESEENEIFSFF